MIPAYEFAVPCKHCSCETDDPCDAFKKIKFPLDEFFPPNIDGKIKAELNNEIIGCNVCDD